MNKKIKTKSWKREFADLVEDSLIYLRKHKRYVYATALLFFASAIIGYVFASKLGFFDEFLKEIIDSTKDLDYLELIWFIFSNNVTSSLSAIFFGAFFGIFPLFNALFNGSILGYVYSKAIPVAGYFVIWRLLPHGIFELPAIFISLGLGMHLGFAIFLGYFYRYKENIQKVILGISSILLLLVGAILGFLIKNDSLFNNHIIYIFIILSVIQFLGIFIFNEKESMKILKSKFKVFLVIVVPLLALAAIIESSFIFLIG